MGLKIFFIILIVFVLLFISFKYLNKFLKKKILSKYISNVTIDSINSLSGQDFEEFLYYLFLNLGFNVTKTKPSHDYGADLLLKINNTLITIQSKLYYNHSVGTSSVQQVYSSTKYYGAKIGIVITNSYFTKSAINLAKSTNVLLWDKDYLIKLINLKNSEKKTFKNKLFYFILNNN